jgi:hypothetical protein
VKDTLFRTFSQSGAVGLCCAIREWAFRISSIKTCSLPTTSQSCSSIGRTRVSAIQVRLPKESHAHRLEK